MSGSTEDERQEGRHQAQPSRRDLLREAMEKKRLGIEAKARAQAARQETRRAAQERRPHHHGLARQHEAPGLVWMRGEPRRGRGHRPMLSQEEIVRTAVRVADVAGIEAVSMRRLAHQLHAGAMSLYWYMSSKEDLLDLMVDEVLGEADPPSGPSGDWRADIRLLAGLLRRAIKRHPWFPAVAAGRPPLGPNALRGIEFGLAALNGIGLDADAVLWALGTVSAYVAGFTSDEIAEQEARRRSGLTEKQWRGLVAPYLERVVESGDYPLLAKFLVEENDAGEDERFVFGLECLLDGIAARAAG